ncbi:Maf family protein [Thiohalospira sp.]|uniref:Maf family protein n=1 Tax=Thiohalospira sp. TaxID=3080549 RepID=UPI00397EBD6B
MAADKPHLHLASASPRRREILERLGLRVRAAATEVDETPRAGEAPAAFVERLAREKCEAGRTAAGGLPVLGADTAIDLDGAILGKPADRAEGLAMLQRLGGRCHYVHTGVAVAGPAGPESRCVTTEVALAPIPPEEAAAYWASGEPVDKAGGYAIQGRGEVFVERIHGSCSAVAGLPLRVTAELLARQGIAPWREVGSE